MLSELRSRRLRVELLRLTRGLLLCVGAAAAVAGVYILRQQLRKWHRRHGVTRSAVTNAALTGSRRGATE